MATKPNASQAAQTGARAKKAATPRAARKPKIPSMTGLQKYELLTLIKSAPTDESDASVAERASTQFGRKVLKVSVAEYRKQFGLASVPNAKPAQLAAYIEVLRDALRNADIPIPPMVQPAQATVQPTIDDSAPLAS